MGAGYMVHCGPAGEEGGVGGDYLEARRLLGYPKTPPQRRAAIAGATGQTQSAGGAYCQSACASLRGLLRWTAQSTAATHDSGM